MAEKQKVLAVDDDQRNQRILQLSLPDVWDVKFASNGQEALTVAAKEIPDLILLDIMMPGIDGYEVCARVRAMPDLAHTKIILVSGKAMLEERIKGYEMGADDYITKPFIPEELAAKVQVFMRLNQAEKALSQLNATLEAQVKERTAQLLEAEAKLISSAKMSALGEMAGGIAHEINTPLAAIGLMAGQICEIVDEDSKDLSAIKKMGTQIEDTVGRIGKIIYGLLAFSRGSRQERLEKRGLKSIVDDTLNMCAEKFKKHGIDLRVDPIPEKLTIECQSTQISQVILNLLNNAFDAVQTQKDDNRWIQIKFSDGPHNLEISVINSGEIIPPEVREKLFQPFFTTKEVGKGTGIGLSLSKGLMEANRGILKFNERSQNTCFTLQFPRVAA
jgi:C4-dicarboxylate-specific signal transduction histidine kinase